MFRFVRHGHPCMFAGLIDRDRRRGKRRIGEGAYWHGNGFLQARDFVMYCRTTVGTEMESNAATFVADANVLRRMATDVHVLAAKARLGTKYAASTALTGQAMADRNSNRFAGGNGGKLPAAAGSISHRYEFQRIVEMEYAMAALATHRPCTSAYFAPVSALMLTARLRYENSLQTRQSARPRSLVT